MRRKGIVVFLSALFFCAGPFMPAVSQAQDRLDALEKEVDKLKDENREMRDELEAFRAEEEETKYTLETVSKMVDVSGYADAEFYHTDQENANDRFRIRHLSLFFTKNIQKEWKLFSEVEYEDAPRIKSNDSTDTVQSSQGTVFVEQLYIEYHPALDWDVRFGRVLTPAGIWSIYHYPPYVPFQTGPLFYKNIFPELADGLQLRNSFSSKDTLLDTHLYIANGAGNSGSGDRNENKAIGARVNADALEGLSAGGSYYRETDNSNVVRTSYGLHLALNYSPVRFQAEYATRHNDPEGQRSFNDSGIYAQLAYDIDKWTLAARYDWYDSNDTDSQNDRYRYTGAVNYQFAENVVAKAEYSRNEFDSPSTKDYNEVILAIVVAIGDL